jgi:hypothetical protein
MASTQLVIEEVRTSSPKFKARVARSKSEHARRCDSCRQLTERRYLVADDLWVCSSCVPEQVARQYPGWNPR